jgi:hypothetical protein
VRPARPSRRKERASRWIGLFDGEEALLKLLLQWGHHTATAGRDYLICGENRMAFGSPLVAGYGVESDVSVFVALSERNAPRLRKPTMATLRLRKTSTMTKAITVTLYLRKATILAPPARF